MKKKIEEEGRRIRKSYKEKVEEKVKRRIR